MSQRIAKAQSLVRQIVAGRLPELLGASGSLVTVTAVEVSPDLRHAVVWIGILGDNPERQNEIFAEVKTKRYDLQEELAKQMETKFVPKLELQPDKGGEYAQYISSLLKDI